MTFCTLLTLIKVMKSHSTYSSPSSVNQYTKSHANCAETVETELYCVHLGVRISVSIEKITEICPLLFTVHSQRQ